MKLMHLLRKAMFRCRTDGFKDMLREMVYVNRTMIVIEKDIRQSGSVQDDDLRFVVLDGKNKRDVECEWPLARHYCSKGARCILAYRGDRLVGHQFYTQENSFPDLVKLGLSLNRNEAYLFDLFVFPEHRGTDVAKKIVSWTFQHLLLQGITKIYGFYFSDNLQSLWWHRAILKCKELKRLRVHRLFVLEWTERKMVVNF
jgi:GNAT superfamily N-acetyltransferase